MITRWIDDNLRDRVVRRVAHWPLVGYNQLSSRTSADAPALAAAQAQSAAGTDEDRVLAVMVRQAHEGVRMLFARDEMLQRVRRLALPKLIFNGVAIAILLWRGPFWLPMAILVLDVVYLLAVYPTFNRQRPLPATLITLGLTALAVAAVAAGASLYAPVLLVFLAPLPVAAAATLGFTTAMRWGAGIATVGVVLTVVLAANGLPSSTPPTTLLIWSAVVLATVWIQTLALQNLTVEARTPQVAVARPVPVANGLMVVAVTDAVFDASSEQIRQTLQGAIDSQGCRWLVLDLSTSVNVSSEEIDRLTEAAHGLPNCKVVLARVPADAIVRPGAPALLRKRLDHFATVTQAVEVGLRHLGWVHPATTPEAREAREPIRIPTSVMTEEWWDKE